ncbi:MAG: BON domain-containing protein [Rhodocyclaceae bacterium]|nr:BON domain-containing protein [Rhodocyclaceae bacterium]
MNQIKMKSLALALGSAVLLGSGAVAHAADYDKEGVAHDKEKSGSVGQYVDDATITARVKSRFAKDSTVSATRIKVDTVKGVVELSGNVASEAERDQAVTLAKGVPDVRGVRNNLTIQGSPDGKPAKSRPAS